MEDGGSIHRSYRMIVWRIDQMRDGPCIRRIQDGDSPEVGHLIAAIGSRVFLAEMGHGLTFR